MLTKNFNALFITLQTKKCLFKYFNKSILPRFLSTNPLVIAEHDNNKLNEVTLNTISAAANLSKKVSVLIAGKSCFKQAQKLSCIANIETVFIKENPKLEHFLPEYFSPFLCQFQKKQKFSHLFFPGTTFGKSILPRLGALLDSQPISDIIEIKDENTFKRPAYAGNVINTVKSLDDVKLLSIRCSSFAKAKEINGKKTKIEKITFSDEFDFDKIKWISNFLSKSERPSLNSAKIIISGGRALKNKNNFSILYKLADKLGGTVGATRAAVDAGYVKNDLQIGQTGQIVAPDLYIAVGISGAIQHLAGMKDSKTIVSINKDPDAPIFEISDYGLVSDLFSAIPELTEKLSKIDR